MKWVDAKTKLPPKTWIRCFCRVKMQGGNIDNAIVTWKYDKWIFDYYGQYEVLMWIDESEKTFSLHEVEDIAKEAYERGIIDEGFSEWFNSITSDSHAA